MAAVCGSVIGAGYLAYRCLWYAITGFDNCINREDYSEGRIRHSNTHRSRRQLLSESRGMIEYIFSLKSIDCHSKVRSYLPLNEYFGNIWRDRGYDLPLTLYIGLGSTP